MLGQRAKQRRLSSLPGELLRDEAHLFALRKAAEGLHSSCSSRCEHGTESESVTQTRTSNRSSAKLAGLYRANRKAPTDKSHSAYFPQPPSPFPPPANDAHVLRPTRSFSRRLCPLLQNPLQMAQTSLSLVREFGRVPKDGIEIRRLACVRISFLSHSLLCNRLLTLCACMGVFLDFVVIEERDDVQKVRWTGIYTRRVHNGFLTFLEMIGSWPTVYS